jgi:hypothetical protein
MKFSFLGLKLQNVRLSFFFGRKECPPLNISYSISFGFFGVKEKEATLIYLL